MSKPPAAAPPRTAQPQTSHTTNSQARSRQTHPSKSKPQLADRAEAPRTKKEKRKPNSAIKSTAWHTLHNQIQSKLRALTHSKARKPAAQPEWTGAVGTFDLHCPYNQYSIPENRDRWKFTIAKQQAAEYNITELKRLETNHAARDTDFARSLTMQLKQRGEEPITRSSYKLPQWLEWLALEPDHEMAAQIYIRGSRGIDITEGTTPPKKHLKNHPSTMKHQELCDTEIERLLKLSYITKWSELRKRKPHLPKEPRIIMPMQAIYKKQKLRIVVNATAAGLNTIDIKGRTKYTTIRRTLEAISTHCYLFRLDVADCFLLAALADKTLELCCIRWRDVTYCYLALFFGSRVGPLHIQNLNTWWLRHSMRTIRNNRLATGTIPEFEKTPPTNKCQYKKVRPKNGKPRPLCILQNLGLLLDDVCGVCSGSGGGLRAAWFAFETIATVAEKLGICISPKVPDKSCPPTKTLTYLGLKLCTRTQKVSLEQSRVQAMLSTLTQVKAAAHITKHQMQSLVGTLAFAAIAVEGPARAAYRLLLDTLRAAASDRPGEKIQITDEARQDIDMWEFLLKNLNGCPITRGIHTKVVPFRIYSDASFSGWCYHTTLGSHTYEYGEWPQSWKPIIGAHELGKYKALIVADLEMLALVMAARKYCKFCRPGSILRCYNDNQVVTAVTRKHSSRSHKLNALLKELEWRQVCYAVEIRVTYCASHENTSDYGSRYGTPGFTDEGLQSVLDKLDASSTELTGYQLTEQPMSKPEYGGILKEHTVDTKEFRMDLHYPPTEELDKLLKIYEALKNEGTKEEEAEGHTSRAPPAAPARTQPAARTQSPASQHRTNRDTATHRAQGKGQAKGVHNGLQVHGIQRHNGCR